MKQISIKNLLEEKKKELERIIERFGVNPILCDKCRKEKMLWIIWYIDSKE